MKVTPWEELVAGGGDRGPVALTIGTFDGIHLGHRQLIRRVVEDPCVLPVVCTFRRSPAGVLRTRPSPGSILSFRQRMERLEHLGVAEVILIDFSPEISKLTGKGFFRLLSRNRNIRRLVVGYNFHMGRGRDTGVAQLREILAGTETELTVVPPAEYKGHTVSSSRIREAIREGRFEESRVMLVSPHCLDLRDLPVRRDGTGVRVRREEISQVLPRTGEYEVTVRMVGGQRPARLSVQHDGIAWDGGSPSVELEICFLQ